jgi:hypothetical protein
MGEEIGSRLAKGLSETAKPQTPTTCVIETFDGEEIQGTVGYPAAAVNAGRRRVIELIQRIRELERAAKAYCDEITPKPSDLRSELRAWMKAPQELKDLVNSLNEYVEPYKSSPDVQIDLATGRLEWDQENTSRRDNGEFQMLSWVIKLSEQGLLDRMRTCSCGRWFFAVRSDSAFCSASCRKSEYEQKSERVERRRANARQYYWLHKNANVK